MFYFPHHPHRPFIFCLFIFLGEGTVFFKKFPPSLYFFLSTGFQDWLLNQRFPNTSQATTESVKKLKILLLQPDPLNHPFTICLFGKDPDLQYPEEELN